MTSARPIPVALPWDAAVSAWTAIIAMRGAGGSGSPRIIIRPMTLVSIPTPLMSLPIRSMSSTSRSSTGSRPPCAVARASSSGSPSAIAAAGQGAHGHRLVDGVLDDADAEQHVGVRQDVAGDARHQLAQAGRAVGVQGLGLHPLAEADRRHLHQPALVRAVEVGVLLDPVDEDRRVGAGGMGVGDDRDGQVVLAARRRRRPWTSAPRSPSTRRPARTRRAPRPGPRRWPRRDSPSPARGTASAPWARTHSTTRATTTRRSVMPRDPTAMATSPPASARRRSRGASRPWRRRRRRAPARHGRRAPGGSGPRRSRPPCQSPGVVEGMAQ